MSRVAKFSIFHFPFTKPAFTQAGSTNSTCASTGNCGQIYIDVNGPKSPNTFGKDIYVVNLIDDNLSPVGAGTDYSNCETSDPGAYSGVNCTAKYIME